MPIPMPAAPTNIGTAPCHRFFTGAGRRVPCHDHAGKREDAGTHAEDLRAEAQVLVHGERCVGDVHPVEVGNHRAEKDGQKNVKCSFRRKTVFHGWHFTGAGFPRPRLIGMPLPRPLAWARLVTLTWVFAFGAVGASVYAVDQYWLMVPPWIGFYLGMGCGLIGAALQSGGPGGRGRRTYFQL